MVESTAGGVGQSILCLSDGTNQRSPSSLFRDNHTIYLMLLSVQEVLTMGLSFVRIEKPIQQRMSQETRMNKFRKHYGSTPLDLAEQWYDLTVTTIPLASLDEKDKTMKGFKMFMVAHYFLWTYPRNAEQLASRFSMNE